MNFSELPKGFTARIWNENDASFCQHLYAESRDDLRQANLPAEIFKQLIQMQYGIQHQGFLRNYPNAEHWIICETNRPIGKLVLDQGMNDLRILDIAILIEARGRGIATLTIQALQKYASNSHLPIHLAVSKTNHTANILYRHLGFIEISDDAVLYQMRWSRFS